jgi:hypothetical protein
MMKMIVFMMTWYKGLEQVVLREIIDLVHLF